MGQYRMIDGLTYELTRKKVKNLNLRVRWDGTLGVSAPKRVPLREIDRFVASKREWILKARSRLTGENPEEDRDKYTDEACLAFVQPVSDRIYPLFRDICPEKPQLRVRWMKSRWGVCHVGKNRITLNKRLMDQPLEALEYVVLHEYVHFLHPNHQSGFHQMMASLMPDYKARRKLLR